ncbi:hypothetical protein HS088_TW21G01287 [Tripterygium wilfordii]|uniref:F-box protein n=1 Tax=Tripterygium wilfordii TaxID=458696 RepID=A0A7J7C4P4_TRIWF|nr:putative F-box protein At2g33200 [Tripterygium wilfordii]KAF5729129.1 hypothetical protein HS088_TW21G01287 [Tripterygium wilfordii]
MDRAAKSMHRDWSQLVPDILDLIASRLSLDDYYRFRSVCTAWRHSRSSYHRHPVPWLVYSKSKTRGFYCLHNNRFYQIPLPKGRCAGTSYGWLIMSHENYETSLFNPFTGNKISLPNRRSLFKFAISENDPLWNVQLSYELTMQQVRQFYKQQVDLFPTQRFITGWKYKKTPYCIKKAILSSEPTMANIAAGRCKVAAIVVDDNFDEHNMIAFCRPGDQSWTSCVLSPRDDDDRRDDPDRRDDTDIIFSEGKFYAIDRSFCLYVLNIEDKDMSWRKLPTTPPSDMKYEEQNFRNRPYLVESRGELLLIIRVMSERPGTWHHYTKSFLVFKLDTTNDPASWVRVYDMDGRVLFVAQGPPQLIELSGFHELSGSESNCFYYVDDDCTDDSPNLDIGLFRLDSPNLDVGLFRLDGRSHEHPFRKDDISCIQNYVFPSIWITPNPY